MTEILNIDVAYDQQRQDDIYLADVLSNNRQDILVLKDVIDDHEHSSLLHCIGIRFKNCYANKCTAQVFICNLQHNCSKNAVINSIRTILNKIIL